MKTINRFIGEYFFLSNFYPSTISFKGLKYPTAEHAYQANKSFDPEVKKFISEAKSAIEAKKLGKSIILPNDWDSIKIPLMKQIIREKFKNPILSELLKSTNEFSLIHENKFNDKFWGVCKGEGQNKLGQILEEIRKEIIEEEY